jgi:competence protein ComGC
MPMKAILRVIDVGLLIFIPSWINAMIAEGQRGCDAALSRDMSSCNAFADKHRIDNRQF